MFAVTRHQRRLCVHTLIVQSFSVGTSRASTNTAHVIVVHPIRFVARKLRSWANVIWMECSIWKAKRCIQRKKVATRATARRVSIIVPLWEILIAMKSIAELKCTIQADWWTVAFQFTLEMIDAVLFRGDAVSAESIMTIHELDLTKHEFTAEDNDSVIVEGRLDTDVEADPKMQCTFGKLKLNLGDSISSDDKCVSCKCTVPPMAHCIQSRDC